MLRTPPKTVINFSPNYETITRLFRDYDTLIAKSQETELEEKEKAPLLYAQLEAEIEKISTYQPFDISTLISLLQIPHLDIETEILKRSPDLNEYDWEIVRQRISVARKWLQDYADEEEKLVLYLDQIPDRAQDITEPQKQYFHKLIQNLEATTNWEGEALQNLIFATSKEVELSQKEAFQAIYFAFLGKERGPKAGSLFSYLDKSFVLKRLSEVSR